MKEKEPLNNDELKQIIRDIFNNKTTPLICKFCGEEFVKIRDGQIYCTLTCELMHFELRNGIGVLPNEVYEKVRISDQIAVADIKIKKAIEESKFKSSKCNGIIEGIWIPPDKEDIDGK